ncbi:hypothetical protein F5X99DRAFT_374211 [Biscogniauxia marginata]|nr:hypothetical protein F5X99DRAFT_374211 [Biscogniauxia marginata]
MDDGQARMLAGKYGFRVASLEYRLAPRHPSPTAIFDGSALIKVVAGCESACRPRQSDPGRVLGRRDYGIGVGAAARIQVPRQSPCRFLSPNRLHRRGSTAEQACTVGHRRHVT